MLVVLKGASSTAQYDRDVVMWVTHHPMLALKNIIFMTNNNSNTIC